MPTLTLTDVVADIRRSRPGLYIRVLGDDVVNFRAEGRDTTNADLDVVRAALTDAGFAEVESWIATEGASWLSDGIRSVSIKVRRTGGER